MATTTTATTTAEHAAQTAMPEVSEQRDIIRQYMTQCLVVGDCWNLIPAPWMTAWRQHVGERPRTSYYYANQPLPNPAAFPGPIDLHTLQVRDAAGVFKLQEFLMEGQHYELIPKAGWELLVQWYTLAPDCEPICRKAIGPDVAPTVEITLLTIKAAVYTDLRTPVPLEISRETSLRHLKSLMCVQFEYPDDDTTQLWTVLYGRPSERLHRLHKLIRESYMIRGELVMIEMQNPDGTWPSDARFAQPAPAP
eukprot:m.462918 g.462918  ORF g.462918 m.462918 type:complete len:251 (-) comp57026_c0_seq7:185-937(-)